MATEQSYNVLGLCGSLRENPLGVLWVNRPILIAMKNDCRHNRYTASQLPNPPAVAHCGKGGGYVLRSSASEPGVNADSCI